MKEIKQTRVFRKPVRPVFRFILLPVLVALGFFLIFHFDLYGLFFDKEKIRAFITSFGPHSVSMFILLQTLQVLVCPLPGDVTGLIGGYLFGAAMGTVYSTIGLVIGSLLAFFLARFLGLPFVERFIKPSIIRTYDHFLEHKGLFIAFILFLIPGFPKDTLCYILGLSHMKPLNFLVISSCGRLLGTILLSIQGTSVRQHQDVLFFTILGVMTIIALLGYFHVGRWLKEHLKGENPE
jgi:uncharacterized membrane protein YdjX (TVP38/TMEM64 family)